MNAGLNLQHEQVNFSGVRSGLVFCFLPTNKILPSAHFVPMIKGFQTSIQQNMEKTPNYVEIDLKAFILAQRQSVRLV